MSHTLSDLQQAVETSFARDTCSFDDLNEWSESNRSRGHCAVTSLVLHDIFGGKLLCAEVHVGGVRTGYHWWNQISAVQIDLTRQQFHPHEVVGEPWLVERPTGHHAYVDQYLVFRSRVFAVLGIPEPL
jgi:hypothetical protein